MKPKQRVLVSIVNTSLSLFAGTTFAAVTGQWDFKAGNLNATVGQAMQYLDSDTQSGTQFGTTAALGIPNIAGQSTNVMKFPRATTELGGYNAPAGAPAQGGGGPFQQYTLLLGHLSLAPT